MPVIPFGSYQVIYIGGGYVGLSGAMAYAAAGEAAFVVDINPRVVDEINRGTCPVWGLEAFLGHDLVSFTETGRLRAVEDWHAALKPSTGHKIIVLALPTERHGEPDMEPLLTWWEQFVQDPDRGEITAVIIESTVVPGTMDRMLAMAKDRWMGAFAIAPRRDWFDQNHRGLRDITRLIGIAINIFPWPESVVARVSPRLLRGGYREVELSKSFENALMYLPVAYAMEVAEAHRDVNMHEVLRLVGTHFDRQEFFIHSGMGGYCVPLGAKYVDAGRTAGTVPSSTARGARKAEEYVRDQTFWRALQRWNFKRPLLIGWSYKAGVHLTHGSVAVQWAKRFAQLDIPCTVFDPMFTIEEMQREVPTVEGFRAAINYDALIVFTPHQRVRRPAFFEALLRPSVRVILDGPGVWSEERTIFRDRNIEYRRLWEAGWDA